MTSAAAGTDRWVRRTISVLLDTGRPGDPAWRLSVWTVLALVGPGSVPFALLLLVVQNLVLRTNYAIGWPTVVLAVGNAAAIVLARFRPLGAWLVLMPTFVLTAMLSPIRDAGDPWPWTVAGLFALLIVTFAIARDARVWTTVATWSLTFGFGLYAHVRVGTDTARENLTMVSLLTVAVVTIGLAVRVSRRARRLLAEEERVTAEERSRRGMLEERARIARELHDVVAHHMSVISVQASTAEYRLAELPADARDEFRSIGDQARESLAEMRRMLAVLRSEEHTAETAPQPGLERLGSLVDSVRRAGVDVTLSVTGVDDTLPAAASLTAYRIIQEGLSNVVRHAAGADTAVSVTGSGTALAITVENDTPPGTGSPPEPGGVGLAGMRERVSLLGGELTAAATGNGGFAVHAVLPYPTTTRKETTR